ncbi:MAG: hypothetical protein A3J62_01525 [Candidatus Buchananbacteria bacterium RIFCSPHIGHO2_02_FULL_38_8]|uniref:Uncharacterized protein n=1 Tax=Candidatus Buchananbacteria bacterium RIFCSPHIGHO2_02_FULL_38_8 TaxID=1797538 RepID=A0A1G1Y3A6_9BACT|nr:MAG: hypothetical protein A3J62_01525 [Candidatus Buchananbacteria bacterium RIFCSPHIGHO2_02_FULL_38_8]
MEGMVIAINTAAKVLRTIAMPTAKATFTDCSQIKEKLAIIRAEIIAKAKLTTISLFRKAKLFTFCEESRRISKA